MRLATTLAWVMILMERLKILAMTVKAIAAPSLVELWIITRQ